MVEHITDSEGRVIAYIEWCVVDSKGIIDDKGEYAFVKTGWIWNGNKHSLKLMRSFIKKIAETFPQLKYAYWKRPKHGGRVKTFTREEIYGGTD